jgi:hypothetical protein
VIDLLDLLDPMGVAELGLDPLPSGLSHETGMLGVFQEIQKKPLQLIRIFLSKKVAGLSFDDRFRKRADGSTDDRRSRSHRLERRSTRLVGARSHQGKDIKSGKKLGEVAVTIPREMHMGAEPELGHQLLERRAGLTFSDQEKPGLRHRPDELLKGSQQQLVTSMWSQAGDGADKGSVSKVELAADRAPLCRWSKALKIDGPSDQPEPLAADPDFEATGTNLMADGKASVGSAIEPSGKLPPAGGATVMKGPEQRRWQRQSRPRKAAEPVVVRVVSMEDLNRVLREEAAESPIVLPEIERDRFHLKRKAFDEREPGGAGFLLKTVPPDTPEPDAVATLLKPSGELNDRVRASRPPPIGGQVNDVERRHPEKF